MPLPPTAIVAGVDSRSSVGERVPLTESTMPRAAEPSAGLPFKHPHIIRLYGETRMEYDEGRLNGSLARWTSPSSACSGPGRPLGSRRARRT